MEGGEGKMRGGVRRMKERLRQGQKLGLGGSGLGGSGCGGKSWEAHFEKTDFACVESQRGRQKMWAHHEQARTVADWKLVGLS